MAFNKIEQGVEQVKQSECYKKYLKVLSQFHDYSVCNSLLIYSQCPYASYIARYKVWITLINRYVIKGSKSIKIIAPYRIKLEKDVDTEDSNDENRYIIRYKTVNVFDISQTEGQELPSIVSEIQDYRKNTHFLLEAFQEQAIEKEIQVSFIDSKEDKRLRSGANGYACPNINKIVIKKDMSINHRLKTMIHEYAHVQLHKDTNKSKEQKKSKLNQLLLLSVTVLDWIQANTLLVISYRGAKE
ncbi:MAG: ArdC-like ssDNA-binding domain-containing protein [Treponema sp.]|nr:ArdC-like ssDNA-binding domain-containing protein [Treponema sp.]